jgi:hypothetical protein
VPKEKEAGSKPSAASKTGFLSSTDDDRHFLYPILTCLFPLQSKGRRNTQEGENDQKEKVGACFIPFHSQEATEPASFLLDACYTVIHTSISCERKRKLDRSHAHGYS